MKKLHTENNFIRYYYGETDMFETMEMDYLFNEDIISNNQYHSFSAQLQLLNEVTIKAPKNVVASILEYSKIKHTH